MAKPIEWVKIHNMPDHVYFNHSLHVVSGKVSLSAMPRKHRRNGRSVPVCRFKHGMVCKLSSVNTNVQFADNNYYSIFQKYHDEIKAGKRSRSKSERYRWFRVSTMPLLEKHSSH
jgi:hypothetical protein